MTNYLKTLFRQVVVSLAICSFTFNWISPSLAHEDVAASPQLILADDFEAVETGELIRATVGTWRGETLLGAIVESDGLPGAPHEKSTKWAKLDRSRNGRTEGHFSQGDVALSGGKLHASFWLYAVRNDADVVVCGSVVDVGVGENLAGRVHLQAGKHGANSVTSNDGNTGDIDRDVDFKDDTWQQWQIWMDIDEGTYEYAIDDAKSGALKLRTQGSPAIQLIEIEPGTAGGQEGRTDAVVYLDDVRVEYEPNPASLARAELQRVRIDAAGTDAYYEYGKAQDIGHKLQLFLDPSSYADRWDVYRRINEPAKHPDNPVVMPDQPWEHSIGLPNVIYDDEQKIFRMWYANYDIGAWGGGKTLKNYKRTAYMISYAESPDGVHWTKPLMDKVPYMGYEKTNIIFTGRKRAQEFCVLRTPEHLREKGRFMLWYRDSLPGYGSSVSVVYSDNGVDWTPHHDNPVYTRALDAQHCPVWDEDRGMWLLYARPQALAANERRYGAENVRTRISVTVSRDMKTWTPARHVLAPDELDRGKEPGNKGYFFDRMTAVKYGNQFLGFIAIQPRHAEDRGHIELASSSDGFRWHRSPLREAFIPHGKAGDWDAGHTWMLTNVVPLGHWLYLYYTGSSQAWRTRYPANTRAIGLARVRRDRFVGQYGDVNGGWLLSREVKVTGDRLLVNVSPEHRAWNHKHHGYVRVELLDRSSGPYGKDHIDGFGQDDCARLGADEYEQVVSWKGNPDLSALKGKNVYLRFYLKSAYLFGFRFADK